jgi:hypothetical protein
LHLRGSGRPNSGGGADAAVDVVLFLKHGAVQFLTQAIAAAVSAEAAAAADGGAQTSGGNGSGGASSCICDRRGNGVGGQVRVVFLGTCGTLLGLVCIHLILLFMCIIRCACMTRLQCHHH